MENRLPEMALHSYESSNQAQLSLSEDLPRDEKWAQGLLLKDEWANSLTHGIGLILSLIGLISLTIYPFLEGDYWKLINMGVYGGTLVLLYTASTLYHIEQRPSVKKKLRVADHCAIYLLIAGSYTPFTMLLLDDFWGWTLFGTVWTLAFLGILSKVLFIHRFTNLSTVLYLLMGWLIVLAAGPLVDNFHYAGVCWLIAGGASYTIGVIFFVMDKRRFFHAIWHLFVLAGSICHYLAIFLYL